MKIKFRYYLDGNWTDKPEPFFWLPVETGGCSDVSGETILALGQPLPIFPDYKTWCRLVRLKQRCGRCFIALRGHSDLINHSAIEHPGAPIHYPQGGAV